MASHCASIGTKQIKVKHGLCFYWASLLCEYSTSSQLPEVKKPYFLCIDNWPCPCTKKLIQCELVQLFDFQRYTYILEFKVDVSCSVKLNWHWCPDLCKWIQLCVLWTWLNDQPVLQREKHQPHFTLKEFQLFLLLVMISTLRTLFQMNPQSLSLLDI